MLHEIVSKAEVLQLVNRTAPGYYEWDPIFDRFLTANEPAYLATFRTESVSWSGFSIAPGKTRLRNVRC